MKLDEIFSFEYLYSAYKNCRKSKQHKGEVIRFETNLSVNLYTLNKELVSKKYTFGKYKRFKIYEPKERLIEALSFKDRVVVRCFCDIVLKNKIESKLIYDKFAWKIYDSSVGLPAIGYGGPNWHYEIYGVKQDRKAIK